MRGRTQYEKFKKGEPLSFKQAILAQCYVCNGLDEGGADCEGSSCPLYQFMPYNSNRRKTRTLNLERIEKLKQGRQALLK